MKLALRFVGRRESGKQSETEKKVSSAEMSRFALVLFCFEKEEREGCFEPL